MNILALFTQLLTGGVTPKAIRSEIYFLGSRHQGEALNGAVAELKAPNLDPHRSRLLRAVVAKLKRERSAGGRDPRR